MNCSKIYPVRSLPIFLGASPTKALEPMIPESVKYLHRYLKRSTRLTQLNNIEDVPADKQGLIG